MTEDNHWTLLRDWLLRDWWSPIEACHIFALLIRTEKNGVYGSRAILSEHRQHPDSDLTKKLKVAQRIISKFGRHQNMSLIMTNTIDRASPKSSSPKSTA